MKAQSLVVIIPLFCTAIAGAQTSSVDCANLTTARDAPTVRPSTGTADRQAPTGIAAQIQPRRATPPRSTFTCRCGTVDAAALIAKSSSQEVPVVTALPASFRFNHVMVREPRQFDSSPNGTLSVAMGRAGSGTDVMTPFMLRNATVNSFRYERPGPPQLSGAYDLVLLFQASFPLGDGATSNLKGGTVVWEVCGFTGPPATSR